MVAGYYGLSNNSRTKRVQQKETTTLYLRRWCGLLLPMLSCEVPIHLTIQPTATQCHTESSSEACYWLHTEGHRRDTCSRRPGYFLLKTVWSPMSTVPCECVLFLPSFSWYSHRKFCLLRSKRHHKSKYIESGRQFLANYIT